MALDAGSSDCSELKAEYGARISEGEDLLKKLEETNYSNIKGIPKLSRKIRKDIVFLSETLENNKLKKEHLICSNLHFYKAIADLSSSCPDCEAVLETFSFKTQDRPRRLTVDIVSHKGQRWTKVIARNPVALHHIFSDGDSYGRRSVIDQATSYVQAAAQNLHMFSPPQVVFLFANGVPEKMRMYLEKLGISVEGEIICLEDDCVTSSSSCASDEENNQPVYCDMNNLPSEQKETSRLNLCITTMIVLVSALTNGGAERRFREPLLTQQAEWERLRPARPPLLDLFKGKELICCETAAEEFKNIVDNVGGEGEKRRAAALLADVRVVPDTLCGELRPSGKIKARSLVIFGTGHAHQAVTVTANKGFVDSAKQKGMKFAVILHESRALTEQKQLPS